MGELLRFNDYIKSFTSGKKKQTFTSSKEWKFYIFVCLCTASFVYYLSGSLNASLWRRENKIYINYFVFVFLCRFCLFHFLESDGRQNLHHKITYQTYRLFPSKWDRRSLRRRKKIIHFFNVICKTEKIYVKMQRYTSSECCIPWSSSSFDDFERQGEQFKGQI